MYFNIIYILKNEINIYVVHIFIALSNIWYHLIFWKYNILQIIVFIYYHGYNIFIHLKI